MTFIMETQLIPILSESSESFEIEIPNPLAPKQYVAGDLFLIHTATLEVHREKEFHPKAVHQWPAGGQTATATRAKTKTSLETVVEVQAKNNVNAIVVLSPVGLQMKHIGCV